MVQCFYSSFLELGGDRDVAVEYLSTSYAGVPKMINLLIQWLQIAGCKQKEIQAMVEEHLTSVILKHFDPKKADHVLIEGGEVRGGASLLMHSNREYTSVLDIINQSFSS